MKEENGMPKKKSNVIFDWMQKISHRLKMFIMVMFSKRLILISFTEVREDGEMKGTRATCKVVGMEYMSAIGITDQFITNEKVMANKSQSMTLKNVIEIYGSMVRVVEDANLKSKCYFDRVNLIVFLDSKRYRTFVMLNKPNEVDKLMGFTGTINVKYA